MCPLGPTYSEELKYSQYAAHCSYIKRISNLQFAWNCLFSLVLFFSVFCFYAWLRRMIHRPSTSGNHSGRLLLQKAYDILTDEVLLKICLFNSPVRDRCACRIISRIAVIKDGIRIGELMCALTVRDNLLPELSRSVNRLYTQACLCNHLRGEGED